MTFMRIINPGMYPETEIGNAFYAIIIISNGEGCVIILIVEHLRTKKDVAAPKEKDDHEEAEKVPDVSSEPVKESPPIKEDVETEPIKEFPPIKEDAEPIGAVEKKTRYENDQPNVSRSLEAEHIKKTKRIILTLCKNISIICTTVNF